MIMRSRAVKLWYQSRAQSQDRIFSRNDIILLHKLKTGPNNICLEDIEVERELENARFPGKSPSKVLHDWIRWERHRLKELEADRRAERRQVKKIGEFDPFECEIYAGENAEVESPLSPEKGDILVDPKIRPAG